jgi:hypothetical protein
MMKVKGMENFNLEIQEKILEIYQMQMNAFGGMIKGHELKEVFIQDNLPCVRFENEDWYHYNLHDSTWY